GRVRGLVDGSARQDHDCVAYAGVDREGQAHRGRATVRYGADVLRRTGLLDVVAAEQRGDVQALLLGDVLVLPLLRGFVGGPRVQHAGEIAIDRRVLGEDLVPVVRLGVPGGAEELTAESRQEFLVPDPIVLGVPT